VNDSDTLTLVAQAIQDMRNEPEWHPIHGLIGAWLTSVDMRGEHVCDVDRDYALVIARTYLHGGEA
jgi:hypothetical protein